jgi:hypothetical protein
MTGRGFQRRPISRATVLAARLLADADFAEAKPIKYDPKNQPRQSALTRQRRA